MTNSTTPLGSKVGRARRRPGQLWQVPTFLVGLLAFVGVAVSAPWRLTPQERDFASLLAAVRDGLDRGEDTEALAPYAEKLRLEMDGFPARRAEAHFLIGSVFYRVAKARPGASSQDVWPRVIEHLDQSLALGGGRGSDKPALQYRLGFALYQQGREIPHALDLMAMSVEKGAEDPLQGYRLIVDAHLKQKAPNVDAALSAARRILDLTSEGNAEAVAQIRLQIGELYLKKKLRAEAFKELERITNKAPRSIRLKARLLQATISEADEQWTTAITLWQELLVDAPFVEGGRGRILYALGWCQKRKEPPDLAECARSWKEAVRFGGPAGQAAGLRLGLLRLARGADEAPQAVLDWAAALEKVETADDFKNPLVNLEEVRSWFSDAINQFKDAQDSEKMQSVAELYRRIAPRPGVGELLVAQAAELHAQWLPEKNPLVKAEEVRAHYRRAGEAYAKAAAARPEAERPDPLWRSAKCYIAAQENSLAIDVLNELVKIKTDETRLAESWFTLGDLLRGAGDPSSARGAYYKCIEIPNTVFANRARLLLAIEEMEQSKWANAHDILKQILATPSGDDRPTQEKAHYKMASLLMITKNYSEAYVYLTDWISAYRESAQNQMAREMFGDCCRRLAEKELAAELELLRTNDIGKSEEQRQILEEKLRDLRIKRKQLLSKAVKTYQALKDELEQNAARQKSLNLIEQELLRRAWFGIGDCHLDAEEFLDAMDTFRKLQHSHRRTLEGFFCTFRIFDISRLKNGQPEWRGMALESVRMLAEDVKALPADHENFRRPGVWQRDRWLQWTQATERDLLGLSPSSKGSVFP